MPQMLGYVWIISCLSNMCIIDIFIQADAAGINVFTLFKSYWIGDGNDQQVNGIWNYVVDGVGWGSANDINNV